MLNPNPEDREIYPYVTCATDKENIRVVDTAVQKKILENIISQIGLH